MLQKNKNINKCYMTDLDPTSSNKEILDNISNLQTMENNMLKNLENNADDLTEDQKNEAIDKINQLSDMRMNLYKSLNGMNKYYMNALDSSRTTLYEQTQAIEIVEEELVRNKNKLRMLEEEKNQKVRLAQVNEYYSEKYTEHALLMKVIIAILVPVLILAILNQKGILPNTPYYILVALIGGIGSYFFGKIMLSIIYRDNMNYQAYNWGFNPNDAPTGSSDTSDTSDPWAPKSRNGLTCVGDACCGDGMVWDSSSNMCEVDDSSSTSDEGFALFTTGRKKKSDLETFVNSRKMDNIKPSVYLGDNIEGAQSSFIFG